jgi:small-conductance mechanosensitive channel
MGIHWKKVVWFLLSLAVAIALFGGPAISQEGNGEKSTPAETTQAVALPSLADLIALTAELDKRLSTQEKDLALGFDSTATEEEFVQFNEKLDALSGRLQKLKISKRYDYDQLTGLKETILAEGASFDSIREPITERIGKIELWSKEWSEEEKQLKKLQSSLAKDASAATLRPTFAKARNTIGKAQRLLASDLKPVLVAEQKAADIQARIDGLLAEVENYLRLLRGDILRRSAPSMFSTNYYAAFSKGLWVETKKGLGDISWSKSQFFERHGLMLLLQVFLTLILIAFILRKRSSLAGEQRLRFLAERPFSAGVFAGFLTVSFFYGEGVGAWRVVLLTVISISLVRVAGALIETVWKKRVVYVLVMLFVLHEFLQFLSLPLPIFRGYVFLVALMGLCLCGWHALKSSREGETRFYRWSLNLGVTVSGVILIAELSGYSGLATHLLESALTTVAFVLAAWMFMGLARGGLDFVLCNTALAKIPLLRRNAGVIVSRVARLTDLFIGALLFTYLLGVWGVYDSADEAMKGVLSLGVTIGSLRLTVGFVLLAALLLYGSLLLSKALQSVLTEEVFPRRNLEKGAQISMARLVHYCFVLFGFLFALAALGLDLRNVTIIGGALGVGIGFGLQNVVNNFVCGLIMLFERPVRVGDTIELGGLWAEIKEIGLRSTIVRTFDAAEIVVPNSDLISNQVTNWTLSDRVVRLIIAVGVAYGSDVPLVTETLMECAMASSKVLKMPEPEVLFREFGESSLDFELRLWIVNADDRLRVASELRHDIDRRFRKAGIEIAFPQRDLHIRSVDPSPGSILIPPGDQQSDMVVVSTTEKED